MALLNQCLSYMESRAPGDIPVKTLSNLSVAFSSMSPSAAASRPSCTRGPCLVIDGRSLAYALEKTLEDKFLFLAKQCRSVLCCRSTPLQKSMVVKLVRSKLKAMTLAIGEYAGLPVGLGLPAILFLCTQPLFPAPPGHASESKTLPCSFPYSCIYKIPRKQTKTN